ncbi:isocitrate lyase [Shigella boydii]|uniref:isocitrate lyase n=1 Tax=Shigella boydii TaxID=621 RepID=UPI002878F3E1|nr:isocitrate lyase [Shigella boydii]MDS1504958.1 isocitrate lyase [Shigella boydii]
MKTRTQQIEELQKEWTQPRWEGITRPYSAEDVVKLRGSVNPECTLAQLGAAKMWRLLHGESKKGYINSLGALTGGQALQQAKAGIEAVYLSGWQVAADANLAASMYPDQSLYPANSVPAVVERINNTFRRADQIQWSAGIEQAISRGLAYAPYADLVWCETSTPDLELARCFAQAIHAKYPGKLLAYNCSPSFNWQKNLEDKTIASFQQQLSDMGYKFQFITLAGIHSMWFNMFDLANAYAQGEGMKHYVEKVQLPEFAAAKDGYTFVSHQQEVGTGYFDKVTTIIQGGTSSVTALTGSTEESQF